MLPVWGYDYLLLQQRCPGHLCVCLCVLFKNVCKLYNLEVVSMSQKTGEFKISHVLKFTIKELNTLTTISLSSAESSILGTDIDLQTIDNDTLSIEIFFKAWLHISGTDQEHIHLLLPSWSFSSISRGGDNPSIHSQRHTT